MWKSLEEIDAGRKTDPLASFKISYMKINRLAYIYDCSSDDLGDIRVKPGDKLIIPSSTFVYGDFTVHKRDGLMAGVPYRIYFRRTNVTVKEITPPTIVDDVYVPVLVHFTVGKIKRDGYVAYHQLFQPEAMTVCA